MNTQFKLKATAVAIGLLAMVPAVHAEPWKFGVMADTQWKSNVDGENPGTVAVGIIKQINQQFIAEDVKFVIQVGDLVDSYSSANMDARVAAAQPLYNAGIGFFPLRGNHESSSASALYVPSVFPQTTGGANSAGASNFSSPFATLNGLSYAFDFGNARFVILDQFTRTDGTNYLGSSNNNIIDQQSWIDATLTGKAAGNHAFVFSHKGLVTANHTDILFGANPSSNPTAQNAFMSSLEANGVRYLFNGHDHNHQRSLIASPDGQSQVLNITTSSNSYKFYVPKTGTSINDIKYNNPPRETPVSQELYTVGYYIVSVDGPKVTVDHYASNNGCGGSLASGGVDCDLTVTPALSFEKRESFGYSLNGKQFVVAKNGSFTVVQDQSPSGTGWLGTAAAIENGVNATVTTLYDGRATANDVSTGWTSRADSTGSLKSDALTLWGMEDAIGSDKTDPYALSLSYFAPEVNAADLAAGELFLATRDKWGHWVRAVATNQGGTPAFVNGAYDSAAHGLGSYGVDSTSGKAWGVINHASDFAVLHLNKIVGTTGRDTLTGTDGDDEIVGGLGADLLVGGLGGDVFVYNSLREAGDTISDFVPGTDRIDASQLLASVGYTGKTAVADGYFVAVDVAGGVLIQFDADGRSGAGSARPLVKLAGLSAAQINLARELGL